MKKLSYSYIIRVSSARPVVKGEVISPECWWSALPGSLEERVNSTQILDINTCVSYGLLWYHGAVTISIDTICSSIIDPEMALGSSLGLNITMAQ